jgi:hypothetical protein
MLQERESELENTMVAKSRSDEYLHKSVNEQKVWLIHYTTALVLRCIALYKAVEVFYATCQGRSCW